MHYTYFAQAREYDPLAGRFTSKDREQFIHPENNNSVNLYAYCHGNPTRFVDPMGFDVADPEEGLDAGAGGIPKVKKTDSTIDFAQALLDYGNKDVINANNCFAYALNVSAPSKGFSQAQYIQMNLPILSAAGKENENALTAYKTSVQEITFARALDANKVLTEYNEDLTGGYAIAMFTRSSDGDYHFYRQNSDGTWSHKLSTQSITNQVSSTKTLFQRWFPCFEKNGPHAEEIKEDPEFAAKEIGYDIFIGYYYVTERTDCS